MAASTLDKLTNTASTTSTRPSPTQVTSTRSAGVFTLQCNALTGWPTDTKVHFCTYKINTAGAKIAGSQIDMDGIVSGTSIGTITIRGGSDVGNAVGDIVEMAPTAAWGYDLNKFGTQEHNANGTHAAVTATSVSAATLTATASITDGSTTLQTMRSEQSFDYVVSGGVVLSGTGYGTTLNWSMTSGVVYIGGKRLTVASATGTVTASKDTYFDLLDPGSGTVATLVNTAGNIVANNAASPALAASSVRIGIIVSGAGSIAAATSVNQGQETMVLPIASSIPYTVTDSLGNLICPRDPNRKVLGYRQIIANASVTTIAQVTGLSCPVIVPTGRKIKVSFYADSISNGATTDVKATIWDGVVSSGTQIGRGQNATINNGVSLAANAITTPAATSKTYNIGASTGSGTATIQAGATFPAYIMVELV